MTDLERAIVNLRAARLRVREAAEQPLVHDLNDAIELRQSLGHADALITAALEAIGGREVPTPQRRLSP